MAEDMKLSTIGIKKLSTNIRTTIKVKRSEKYLIANRNTLGQYSNIDDYIHALIEGNDKSLKAIEYHLEVLIFSTYKALWSNGYFVGRSVIEQLMFYNLRNHITVGPIKKTLRDLKSSNIVNQGFALFPLHSMGIIGMALLRAYAKVDVTFFNDRLGIIVSAQSNSMDNFYDLMNNSIQQLRISKRLPVETIKHYIRSRSLQWTTKNPLLICRFHSLAGSMYEMAPAVIIKLRFAKGYLVLLDTLSQRHKKSSTFRGFSTSVMNNWETLDIKHYLVFQSQGGSRELLVDCIPMNISRTELVELSDLGVELDPREWKRKTKILVRIENVLMNIEKQYVTSKFAGGRKGRNAIIEDKLFTALKYFTRSVSTRNSPQDNIVNLAIAFEVLLLDNYLRGVQAHLLKRLKKALAGVRGTRKFQNAFMELYDSRCDIVHSGSVENSPDLLNARQAFAHAFLSIAEKMGKVKKGSLTPIADLLNL